MKHCVNISGGGCSILAAHRVVERFGTRDVTFLFADTLIEDAGLYACNQHLEQLTGIQITRVCDGRTPWQLFREEGLIGNSRFPICSVRLKRDLLDKWRRQNLMEMDSTIYVGFDWTEEHRLLDLRREIHPWRVEAPMQDRPLLDKCQIIKALGEFGYPEQELYRLGFPHNNCGGRCVRAGISHFVHLYKVLPLRFLEWELEELNTAEVLRARGIEPFSVLKDRRGGTVKPLWLRDLRLRIEANEELPKHDWGGCGCGGATKDAA